MHCSLPTSWILFNIVLSWCSAAEGAHVFGIPELRESNPNARDISNAPSAGTLLDQPIGLAYIAAAPLFERTGPIRFKRSVSGNRYKPMPSEAASLQNVTVGNSAIPQPVLEGHVQAQSAPQIGMSHGRTHSPLPTCCAWPSDWNIFALDMYYAALEA